MGVSIQARAERLKELEAEAEELNAELEAPIVVPNLPGMSDLDVALERQRQLAERSERGLLTRSVLLIGEAANERSEARRESERVVKLWLDVNQIVSAVIRDYRSDEQK